MTAFFDRIKSPFTPKTQPPPPGARWVEPDQNAFRIRVLDCRPLVRGITAWSENKEVVETFTRLRESDGSEHIGQLPENPCHIQTSLTYPYAGERTKGGPIFKAESMDDKWDIYLHRDHLYFARSWTGILAYVASCSFGDHACIKSITAAADDTPHDHAYPARAVDFLVKSHLFGIDAPHPFPTNMRGAAENELALYSFSTFGNRGQFGTFEETLNLPSVETMFPEL